MYSQISQKKLLNLDKIFDEPVDSWFFRAIGTCGECFILKHLLQNATGKMKRADRTLVPANFRSARYSEARFRPSPAPSRS